MDIQQPVTNSCCSTISSVHNGAFLISVIIPIHNGEKTIERAVRSVLQNRSDAIRIEILLIDDGSSDATAAICDRLSLEDGIRTFHVTKGGASAARNVGLREAKGEYICFVDSDDWIEPDMYRELLEALLDHSADFAACGVIHETEYGAFHEESDDTVTVIEGQAVYEEILQREGMRGYIWNKLFKRALIRHTLDEKLMQCEDLLFTAAYCEHVGKAVYVHKALYHYTRRKDSYEYSYTQRDLSLMDAQEKLYALYAEKAPQYAFITAQNLLKTYLHFRARAKLCGESDETLLSKIRQGIRTFFFPVMTNRKVSLLTKGNICFTYLFPRLSLRLKRMILQRRHRKGVWES